MGQNWPHNAMLLSAISRFNIAFGFGDSSVGQVCRDNGVDTDIFLCVCNLLSGYRYNVYSISLKSLMGYLRRAHTSFLDVTFPKIRHYHEECNIAKYSVSHVDTAAKLKELKDIFIYHYKQKENARLSGALFDIIICERDMLSHFDVESKLFIPAVEKLEKELCTSLLETDPGLTLTEENSSAQVALLSEREKDIIRSIAQGKVNKGIADELCISVHTVATHRRNISAKLEIHTAAGLTIFAIIHHLVDVNEVTPV